MTFLRFFLSRCHAIFSLRSFLGSRWRLPLYFFSLLVVGLGVFGENAFSALVFDEAQSHETKLDQLVLHPPAWTELTTAQQKELVSQGSFFTTVKIEDHPWPLFRVYALVKATPEQVAAAFWDVTDSPEYVADCTKVKVLGRPAPTILDAQYTIKMPFVLPDDVSRVRNWIAADKAGGYQVHWQIEEARYSKSGKGSLTALPYQSIAASATTAPSSTTSSAIPSATPAPILTFAPTLGATPQTLMIYANFINPRSKIASLLLKAAESRVQQTAAAIVRQVEEERANPQKKLATQLEELKKALAQQQLHATPEPQNSSQSSSSPSNELEETTPRK